MRADERDGPSWPARRPAHPATEATGTIRFTGKGDYAWWSDTVTFDVERVSLSDAYASALGNKLPDHEYTGKQIKPGFSVCTDDGLVLDQGIDYEVEYGANTDCASGGTASVRGIGMCTGALTATFAITPAPISGAQASAMQHKFSLSPFKPDVAVSWKGAALVEGRDFAEVQSVEGRLSPGTHDVPIKGTGNFEGTTIAKLDVTPASLDGATVSGIPAQVAFSGPPVTFDGISVTWKGSVLDEGADYALAYRDNSQPVRAHVDITGLGGFAGSARTVPFEISPAKASLRYATVTRPRDRTYTGQPIFSKPTVSYGGSVLVEGRDYRLTFEDNVSVGEARVIIEGIGDYADSLTSMFGIEPARITTVSLSTTSATYDGKPHVPHVNAVIAEEGTPVDPTDYSLSYWRGQTMAKDFTSPGDITVKAEGRNSCYGSASATFTIAAAAGASASASDATSAGASGSNRKGAAASQTDSATRKAPKITARKLRLVVKQKTVKKKKAPSFKMRAKSTSGGRLSYKVLKKNRAISFKAGKATLKKGGEKRHLFHQGARIERGEGLLQTGSARILADVQGEVALWSDQKPQTRQVESLIATTPSIPLGMTNQDGRLIHHFLRETILYCLFPPHLALARSFAQVAGAQERAATEGGKDASP